MENRIIIYATDIALNVDKAKLAVIAAAEELGVKYDCQLSQSWKIWIDKSDRATFLELVREKVI